MMTLEEAIKHAEYIVNNRKDAISVCWSVRECEQIAEWLRELQERREEPEVTYCKDCVNRTRCTQRIKVYTFTGTSTARVAFCSRGKRAERKTE